MCGIIGIVNKNKFISNDVLIALKRLEYRGYDSFGIATDSGLFEKDVGEIGLGYTNSCNMAIGHTRWATHGGVTKANAHPHADCSENLFIVHNGIIENYAEIKNELIKKGHTFRSETDSEVIAHFFEEGLKTTDMKQCIENFFKYAKGEFAVVIMIKCDKNLYCLKRGSPLCLGITNNGYIIASDIYAFSDKTDKAIFFNENEFAIINENVYDFYLFNKKLEHVMKDVTTIKWTSGNEAKKYEHYMIKEIYEEAGAIERLLGSLKTEQKSYMEKLKELILAAKRTVFVASGTSYHATLLGVYFLNKAGIEAHTIIASEFRNFYLVDEGTLIIAVTQSGETMDVIEALHGMKARGATIASLVNVPYSTVQRMSNASINIEAGQEICVAATKSFVNQVVCLYYLATMFQKKPLKINNVTAAIKSVISQEGKIKEIAESLAENNDIYIIGRGFLYPVAREIALKLKEISYVHAEGMMGGELKHGTLALIEKGTPVIALVNGGEIISNVMEVKARGGRIISISNAKTEDETIKIDAADELSFATAAAVAGQLLTYYIAKERKLPIDKPRNLAKSVTVK